MAELPRAMQGKGLLQRQVAQQLNNRKTDAVHLSLPMIVQAQICHQDLVLCELYARKSPVPSVTILLQVEPPHRIQQSEKTLRRSYCENPRPRIIHQQYSKWQLTPIEHLFANLVVPWNVQLIAVLQSKDGRISTLKLVLRCEHYFQDHTTQIIN